MHDATYYVQFESPEEPGRWHTIACVHDHAVADEVARLAEGSFERTTAAHALPARVCSRSALRRDEPLLTPMGARMGRHRGYGKRSCTARSGTSRPSQAGRTRSPAGLRGGCACLRWYPSMFSPAAAACYVRPRPFSVVQSPFAARTSSSETSKYRHWQPTCTSALTSFAHRCAACRFGRVAGAVPGVRGREPAAPGGELPHGGADAARERPLPVRRGGGGGASESLP